MLQVHIDVSLVPDDLVGDHINRLCNFLEDVDQSIGWLVVGKVVLDRLSMYCVMTNFFLIMSNLVAVVPRW